MSEQTNQDRKLSEIGHLFLSTIRQKASNGNAPPRRIPPGQRMQELGIDLTADEIATVGAEDEIEQRHDESLGDEQDIRIPPVTAIIASHLNGKQLDRAREYARHLTADGSRIGMIEVDASEFRLMCFGSGESEAQPEPDSIESFDAARMTEALNEMSCDVDQWLLLVSTPRIPEARGVLREAARWTMLCTCDHDGVLSAYRTLKGLSELFGAEAAKPKLSLALLDAVDEDHAQRISAKVSSACGQFLAWPIESSTSVQPALESSEYPVLLCRPLHDKTQIAAASQWGIVSDFIARSKACGQEDAVEMDTKKWARRLAPSEPPKRLIAEVVVPTPADEVPEASPSPAHVPLTMSSDHATESAPVSFPISQGMHMKPADTQQSVSDVIDLAEDASDVSILSAVLHAKSGDWVECPISPPMCPTARLAVGRDKRIVLVALARQGLTELPNIGHAFRWLIENRGLIGMAVPQMAIDPMQQPQLSLLVDHADSSASTLRPMLQSGQVTVQTYRTLRWSGKKGLLLEAA
ncbi:MAG TPA: hypothetical protein VF669_11335 [Tepidisphaeraceae bacterium]|jgi:hypothetical protein